MYVINIIYIIDWVERIAYEFNVNKVLIFKGLAILNFKYISVKMFCVQLGKITFT